MCLKNRISTEPPIPIFSIGKVASLRPKPGVGASRIPLRLSQFLLHLVDHPLIFQCLDIGVDLVPVHIQNVGKFVCGRCPFLFDHGYELFAPIELALRLAGLDDIRIKLAGLWIDRAASTGRS